MRIRRAIQLSDMGPSRRYNGDAILSSPDIPVFGVADATGGPDVAQVVIRQLIMDSGVLRDCGQRVEVESSTANRLAIGHFFENLFNRASDVIRAERGSDKTGITAR